MSLLSTLEHKASSFIHKGKDTFWADVKAFDTLIEGVVNNAVDVAAEELQKAEDAVENFVEDSVFAAVAERNASLMADIKDEAEAIVTALANLVKNNDYQYQLGLLRSIAGQAILTDDTVEKVNDFLAVEGLNDCLASLQSKLNSSTNLASSSSSGSGLGPGGHNYSVFLIFGGEVGIVAGGTGGFYIAIGNHHGDPCIAGGGYLGLEGFVLGGDLTFGIGISTDAPDRQSGFSISLTAGVSPEGVGGMASISWNPKHWTPSSIVLSAEIGEDVKAGVGFSECLQFGSYHYKTDEYYASPQLGLSSEALKSVPDNGQMIKPSNSATVFLMENGVRRALPDMTTLYALGLNPNEIQTMSQSSVHKIPSGLEIPSRMDGNLLKGSSTSFFQMSAGKLVDLGDEASINQEGLTARDFTFVTDVDLSKIPAS